MVMACCGAAVAGFGVTPQTSAAYRIAYLALGRGEDVGLTIRPTLLARAHEVIE